MDGHAGGIRNHIPGNIQREPGTIIRNNTAMLAQAFPGNNQAAPSQ